MNQLAALLNSSALLAQATAEPPTAIRILLISPLFWSLVTGALGLWLAIIGGSKWPRRIGMLLGAVGLLILGSQLPRVSGNSLDAWGQQIIFWILAAMLLVSASAVIIMRSPVYSAVWFAVTLLSVSGLLFVQGAQFLGVATMAVYAGAILVTFLFVLMLAQPEGFAFYDRLSWGNAPAAVAVAACLTFAAGATYLIAGQQPLDGGPRQGGLKPMLRDRLVEVLPAAGDNPNLFTQENLLAARMVRPDGSETDILLLEALPPADLPPAELADWSSSAAVQVTPLAAESLDLNPASFQVLVSTRENLGAQEHVARLGGNLFSRHLISIQAAGALLLAALVGAVAICMQEANSVTNDLLLQNYLVLGVLLMALGLIGFLVRRNMIIMFLCAEMMLQGVSLSAIAWGKYHNSWSGQSLMIFVIAVAACEAAIALALVLMLFRQSNSLDVVIWQEMREESQPAYHDEQVPEEREEDQVWPSLTPSGREPAGDIERERHRTNV